MSFRTSGLQPTTYGHEKPVIFWDQQAKHAADKKRKKQFGYKEKEQKFPIRSTKPPPAQPAATKPTKPVAKKNPTVPATHPKLPATTTRGKTNRLPPVGGKKVDPNMVTLTETQLNSILETIGKLAKQNEVLLDGNSPRKDTLDGSHLRNSGTQENILTLLAGRDPRSNERGGAESVVPLPSPLPPSEVGEFAHTSSGVIAPSRKVEPDPSSIPGLEQVSHKYSGVQALPDSKQVAPDPASIPGLGPIAHKYAGANTTPRSNAAGSRAAVPDISPVGRPPPGVPKAHLTKAERKRLEWQQQQQENDENTGPPWMQPERAMRTGRRSSVPADQAAPAALTTLSPPLSKAELKRLQWEQERRDLEALQKQSPRNLAPIEQPEPVSSRRMSYPPDQSPRDRQDVPVPLTKAQKKRLELEKQRKERVEDYDPWGRPGAGAPVRDSRGNIMADFNARRDGPVNSQQSPPGGLVDPSASQEYFLQKAAANHRVPPVTSPHVTSPSAAYNAAPPVALRSSFAVGGQAPDDSRFNNTRDSEKKQWLADLERQRQEQQAAKERQKFRYNDDNVHDTWADRFSTRQAAPLPPQHTLDDSSVGPSHKPQESRTLSAPNVGDEGVTSSSVFLRGQNAAIDPVTKQHLEEKRKRCLEHQEALQQQVEEKARKKREEAELIRREEMEEERKMKAERDRIQNQLDMEQQKIKDKEELQKQRADRLQQAMEAAQVEADRVKHAQRMQKLQQGGHDTAQLHARFEAPSVGGATVSPHTDILTLTYDSSDEELQQLEAKQSPRVQPSSQHVHVEPSYVPGLHPTPRDGGHAQTVDYGVTSGRILTPSAYRTPSNMSHTMATSPRREFGVQTDPNLAISDVDRKASAGIEFRGPFKDRKKVRVQSAEKEVKKPPKITDRPKWGQKSVPKKAVKQSERDPNYQRRLSERQQRGEQRQRELLEMAQQNAPDVARRTTVNSRTRSRSRDGRAGSNSRPRVPSGNDPEGYKTTSRARSRSPPRDTVRGHATRDERISRADSGPRFQPSAHSPDVSLPSHSPEPHHTYYESQQAQHFNGRLSPPIPTIKHRQDVDADDRDPPRLESILSTRSKPKEPVSLTDTNFVPFLRSDSVLDPAHAEDPFSISREATAVERGRQAYIHSNHPADYGNPMQNYDDARAVPQAQPGRKKDPIMNPSLLREHPTGRQDQILQQLSDLRRGLIQKQRELEIGMPAPQGH